MISEEASLASAVINALSSHICVINNVGEIIAVNRAWQDFTIANPPVSNRAGVGMNYLEVCQRASGMDREEATKFAAGGGRCLNGAPNFLRWNILAILPLKTDGF